MRATSKWTFLSSCPHHDLVFQDNFLLTDFYPTAGEIVMFNEEMDFPMHDEPVVRQNFPETWLWMDVDLG